MPNMSYCRFQNTLLNLQDCLSHIEDNNLSKDEASARERLIRVCRDIVETADEMDENVNNFTEDEIFEIIDLLSQSTNHSDAVSILLEHSLTDEIVENAESYYEGECDEHFWTRLDQFKRREHFHSAFDDHGYL